MSTIRDIYNPPPAPVAWETPAAEPLTITRGDWAWLAGLCAVAAALAAYAWAKDPVLGVGATVGGIFVCLESWFSGLTFLRRHPSARPAGRGLIFLAALVPWLIGLGFTGTLIWGLFLLSDLFG